MFDLILLAVDGSEHGQNVVSHAACPVLIVR